MTNEYFRRSFIIYPSSFYLLVCVCCRDTKIGTRTNSTSDDPGSDPSRGRSIFWRVIRAALPFHMVIVVLLGIACLLEPNCCDTINNLNLSFSPQLRYVSGPPPTWEKKIVYENIWKRGSKHSYSKLYSKTSVNIQSSFALSSALK